MSSLVNIQSFQKSYGPLHILESLNFELNAGESLAIVGASGVGKSTFLHCLGLLDHFDSGKYWFAGQDVTKFSEKERLKTRQEKIGFVFQFHYLMAELTALENVMLPLMISNKTPNARETAVSWLSRLGLAERLTHRPSELSGGEQQRVAIARALVQSPSLIIADEPTGNLDPETGLGVFELLKSRAKELGAALVVATHNLELARQLGRSLQLKRGRFEA